MKIVCRSNFFTFPLIEELKKLQIDILISDNPNELLLNGEADIAIASPLDFLNSRETLSTLIISSVGVISKGFSSISKLIFKSGLKEISTFSFKESNFYERLISEIILSEKFDFHPEFLLIDSITTIDDYLNNSDCTLVIADSNFIDNNSYLDLSDEWEDLTESSLVHILCYTINDDKMILKYDFLKSLVLKFNLPENSKINFQLDEDSLKGLDIFFNYTFLKGLIGDLPQTTALFYSE
ncbi:MAG: hypothetical protein IPP08_12550 [Chlorobiota bacterium]|nr:hypothetical protein [Chlorobiota bacterium]QQS66566.1 MAG: hypothetical protein IPP08_12550 [Chlorobiota bacterium]